MNHYKDNTHTAESLSAALTTPKRVDRTLLFHADATDPDMLYFSRFQAFDPFIAFSAHGKRYAVMTAGEYGRMANESAIEEILLLDDVRKETAKRFQLPRGAQPDSAQMILHLAAVFGITTFEVSPKFPVGISRKLREAGMLLEIASEDDGLLPERTIKTAAEVAALREANRASEAGFALVRRTLEESKIRKGVLIHNGSVLTAERLRDLINHATLDAGALALHTIAAPGDQAVDNHCVGYGPIRAGELIVVDIFPRRIADGYWGDMTRTYLKGKATDAQRRLVRTVKKAHQMAIEMTRPGVTGGKVHDTVQAFFDKEGYETIRASTQPKGFFHALGHGVGLEIHESPIMRSKSPWKFRKGMVLTIEPGLYYPGLGGCRIEDTVHLINGGCELISRAPYKWEIP